jgi:hypothetical protein
MAIIRKRTNEDKELKALQNSVGTLDMSTKSLGTQLEDLGTIIKRDLVNSISKLTETVKTDGKDRKKQTDDTKKSNKSNKPSAAPVKDKMAENILDRNKITASVTKLFDGLAPNLKTSLTKLFGQAKVDKAINRFTDKATGQGNQKFADYKELRAKGMGAKDAMGKVGMDAGQVMKFTKAGAGGAGGKMDKFASGKGIASKALSGVGGGIMKGAGMLMKAAGPIGAAFSIGMQIVDYFDSGKFTKTLSDASTFFGGAGANKTGVTESFKGTKQYRKMVADFNIVEPVKEEFAQRRDMMDFQKGVEQDRISLSNDKVKDEYNMRFTKERAWIDFAHGQAVQNIDAEHAQRKTLFMSGMRDFKKYIGVGERALNAIGSSTEAVLSAISSVGKNLGASVKDMIGMSAAAAGISKLLGSSAEDVLSMGNTFRLMNKTSLTTGTNLTAGIKAFADKNGVMASVIMKDMTDSSAELYKFSSGTAENFAKQAVQLNKMGTSMSTMMKASDSMVLNYKDSIKAEMSLSAMLGQNVDLSETRAKLMSGDQAGAAESLRNSLGGQDVGAMNAFQKQQLSQATGMDIDQLMSLQQGGAGDTKGGLEEKNAKKTGAAIANGALQQDISNEAAKLAMDLAHQEKMMKFEQDQRKGMLFLEQSQRLQNLAIEAKWRIKYAKMSSEEQVAMAVAEMQAESASKLSNNLFQDAAKTFKDNLTKTTAEGSPEFAAAMDNFNTNSQQSQAYVMDLVNKGILNADNAGMAMADIAQKVAKGTAMTTDEVNKILTNNNAFANATKAKEDEQKAAEAELKALKDKREAGETGEGNWASRNIPFARMINFGGNSWEDKKANVDANDKKEQELQARIDKLAAEKATIVGTGANAGDPATIKAMTDQTAFLKPFGEYFPAVATAGTATTLATEKIASNDDVRGIIFKKQYDYQAKISNENTKATYAVLSGIEQLAAAQGKPITIDGTGVASTINKLSGLSYAKAV